MTGPRTHWMTALPLAFVLGAPGLASAADCVKVSETCVDGPATHTISGQAVTRDCWRYHVEYSCVSQKTTDDCQPLRDRGCSQTGSTCIDARSTSPNAGSDPPSSVGNGWPLLRPLDDSPLLLLLLVPSPSDPHAMSAAMPTVRERAAVKEAFMN